MPKELTVEETALTIPGVQANNDRRVDRGTPHENQVLLMLSKLIEKTDIVRDRFEVHILTKSKIDDTFQKTMTETFSRIEARIDKGSKAIDDLEGRIDGVEKDIAWAKGGKSAVFSLLTFVAACGCFIGWLLSTFNITFTK